MHASADGLYPWDGLPVIDHPDRAWHPVGVDGYVCLRCLGNGTLGRIWGSDVNRGRCCYCGRNSVGGVRSSHRLITYIYRSLKLEYLDTESRTGSGITPEDVLARLGERLGPAPTAQLVRSVPERWRAIDGVSVPIESRMVESWQDFAHQIRRGPRFGFSGRPGDVEPHRVDDVFRFFDKSVANLEGTIVKVIEPGLELFRARVARDGPLRTADQLGSPPMNKAGPQRMSAAGVSCFYAAEEHRTALAEMRVPAMISVGRWRTVLPFRYLELSQPWQLPSIFEPVARASRRSIRFVRDFETEISKPKDDHIGDANSYLPTQIFAEYLRYSVPTSHGHGVDAVRYRSDARIGGINWCFFGRPERSDDPAIEFLGPVSGPG